MRAQVFIDAAETCGQVVRVGDHKTAGAAGQLAQPALWIELEQVFVALQLHSHGAARTVFAPACQLPRATFSHRFNLACGFGIAAFRAQPAGLDRIDGDVSARRRVDDRRKTDFDIGRQRQPFREEHDSFAARHALH